MRVLSSRAHSCYDSNSRSCDSQAELTSSFRPKILSDQYSFVTRSWYRQRSFCKNFAGFLIFDCWSDDGLLFYPDTELLSLLLFTQEWHTFMSLNQWVFEANLSFRLKRHNNDDNRFSQATFQIGGCCKDAFLSPNQNSGTILTVQDNFLAGGSSSEKARGEAPEG